MPLRSGGAWIGEADEHVVDDGVAESSIGSLVARWFADTPSSRRDPAIGP
jgi:hypothetical protein